MAPKGGPPKGPDHIEEVTKACRLRSRRALDELWREYPDNHLWEGLVRVLPSVRRPTYTFVRGYLADHARRKNRFTKEHTLIDSRKGRCAGCGVLNCPGKDWECCPWKTGVYKRDIP